MKNSISLFIILCFLFSCGKKEKHFKVTDFTTVKIETLLQDSLLSVRALEVDANGFGSFATSNGKIGGISRNAIDEEARLTFQLKEDTIIPNFRALAVTNKAGFVLSIASPALLYKIDKDSLKIVYKENHEKAFYDAIHFWNDQEGIAIGDPTEGCMSIIITRDGGNTWSKLSCDVVPKAIEGEAAFAASDTNIAIVGDKTWVATGGKASRILFSSDKGKTWKVIKTPITQGLETTGMYSVDFYDENNGFAIGGDYTKAADSTANKIRTVDGGKTWQLVAQNQSPGYRSCVQYVPNSNAKALVAIGFKGIDYSSDSGNTWKHLSDEGFYTLRFINDSIAYAAGAGRISKLTFK
ncbi:oxidoreductase [Lacinutrix sp. C3R15]|uniref:WD40/YVTN/BNR-like repeat-containing protein n=1 Tax=Flavobacteriaceae TaxID=49546 RepID=UPI001C080D2C|nr:MULTISPECIES: oxidoreductase [Flavobacteriaceae]MBU2938900.1 oxidoreductase [Lacinutrix sp. C3R15]MDO6622213.1 oxidoreductase [Oceanihabitans sp. 1_MG-2023]